MSVHTTKCKDAYYYLSQLNTLDEQTTYLRNKMLQGLVTDAPIDKYLHYNIDLWYNSVQTWLFLQRQLVLLNLFYCQLYCSVYK